MISQNSTNFKELYFYFNLVKSIFQSLLTFYLTQVSFKGMLFKVVLFKVLLFKSMDFPVIICYCFQYNFIKDYFSSIDKGYYHHPHPNYS